MSGPSPAERLVDLLDLEEIDLNIFRGESPHESLQRVFGGQVAGQALVAAGRTVDASPDDPQYQVRSDKSGRSAVHKPSALKKK